MEIHKIVTFGCSWTYGDELGNDEYRNKHVWGNLIANHNGWEFENHGFPGASLKSIRDSIIWYVTNNDVSDTLFVVGLTSPERQSWFNNNHECADDDPPWMQHIHSIWMIDNEKEYSELWQSALKSFIIDQQCRNWVVNNFNETVLLIDGISKIYNVPIIQVNMFDEVLEGVAPESLYMPGYNFGELLDDTKQDVWKPGGHPNELGHQIIANKLISYIDSAILTK